MGPGLHQEYVIIGGYIGDKLYRDELCMDI